MLGAIMAGMVVALVIIVMATAIAGLSTYFNKKGD
jgi:hypothetical protein